MLNGAERRRAAQFRSERDALSYRAAHVLTRMLLSHAVGGSVAPSDWVFKAAPGGKPRVAGAGPHFSLAHCHGLVGCAVSHRGPVGLDLEPVDRDAALEVAEAVFAAAELAWLRALPPAEQVGGAVRLWTLREAWSKAAGHGMASPRRDVAFDIGSCGITLAGAPGWQFHQQCVGRRHVLALASPPGSGWPVQVVDVRAMLPSAG